MLDGGKKAQRERTNVGRDACEDDLAFARGSDRVSELGVVPGVDFPVALDVGRIWGQLEDFLGKGSVGALLGTGGQDDRQIEEFGNRRVRDDVLSEFGGIIVAHLQG